MSLPRCVLLFTSPFEFITGHPNSPYQLWIPEACTYSHVMCTQVQYCGIQTIHFSQRGNHWLWLFTQFFCGASCCPDGSSKWRSPPLEYISTICTWWKTQKNGSWLAHIYWGFFYSNIIPRWKMQLNIFPNLGLCIIGLTWPRSIQSEVW